MKNWEDRRQSDCLQSVLEFRIGSSSEPPLESLSFSLGSCSRSYGSAEGEVGLGEVGLLDHQERLVRFQDAFRVAEVEHGFQASILRFVSIKTHFQLGESQWKRLIGPIAGLDPACLHFNLLSLCLLVNVACVNMKLSYN